MKIMNFLYGAICVALAGNMLGACTNDDDVMTDSSTAKVPMTFTAGNSSTRTALGNDGKVVNWVKGDAIALYDGIDYNEFITQDEGTTASFVGEARPAESYAAFYPYASIIKDRSNGNNIVFNLPAEQTAVPGSFATGLVPSWAQTVEGSNVLQFHNLCALVKFTVGDDMDGEGVFILRGVKSGGLAGEMNYTIGHDSSEAYLSGEISAEVRLSGKFEAGETYYFVVAPGYVSGLSIFYRDSKGIGYRRGSLNPVTFGVGTVTDLGIMSMDTFEKAIVNVEIVKAAKSSNPSIEFGNNPDGTITLNDVNRKIIESVSKLYIDNNRGIIDLSDIEYFSNLTILRCYNCEHLESLDVSSLNKLTDLECSHCEQLSLFNVKGLSNLTRLTCTLCKQLEPLDLTGLSNLTMLECSSNGWTSLDLSDLKSLEELRCNYNQFSSLDLSDLKNLVTLDCSLNHLSQLDITANTSLNSLSCGDQLSNLILYLTLGQKNKWDIDWIHFPGNSNVTPQVKD